MNISEIFLYLAELTIMLGGLYGYYRLSLANEKRLEINRLFLLGSVVLSLILPLFDFELQLGSSAISTYSLQTVFLDSIEINAQTSSELNWGMNILIVLYSTGFIIAFIRFCTYLWQIMNFINRAGVGEKTAQYTLIYTNGKISTSSFFSYLLWDNTTSLSQSQTAQVLAHELSHIKGKHSWDLMFLESMKILLWFHPLIYLISRDLKQTHEYIADNHAIKQTDSVSYMELLVTQMFGQQLKHAHSFFHSPLKKRIMMLNQENKKRQFSSLRYLFIIPLIAGLGLAVSCSTDNIPSQKQVVLKATQAKLVYLDEGVEVDKEPEILNMNEVQKAIGYPKQMREELVDGQVLVRILVGTSGEYLEHTIVESPHEAGTNAVSKHIPELKFTPAMKNGKPVKVWVNVPFNFKLLP